MPHVSASRQTTAENTSPSQPDTPADAISAPKRTGAAGQTSPPFPDRPWLTLAAALARRAVDGQLAVAALATTNPQPRAPLVARYDGDQPALSRKNLARVLRRVGSQHGYIGSLRHPGSLPGFRDGASPGSRQALIAVQLPIGETPGCLMVLGRPGQHFDAADLVALDDVAQTMSRGIEQAAQGLAADRRRIERLLHDTFAATLTGLLFNLGRLSRTELSLPGRELAERAYADVRTALRQLRGVLDSVGQGPTGEHGRLSDLLRDLADDQVTVCTNIDGHLAHSLHAEVLACIYEVAREALVNVRRHACASRVELLLERVGRRIEFVVSDDGRGCPRAMRDPGWGGHGLRLMRERVAEVGGELHVSSGAGSGTQLRASFPTSD